MGLGVGIGMGLRARGVPGISPNALSGLTGWWRGDLGMTLVSGNARVWSNQGSGGGSFDQTATAGARPLFVADCINGQPGLRFNGTAHYMGGPLTSALITAAAGTLLIVYRPISISRNVASPIYSNDGILTDVGSYFGFHAQNSAGGLARGVNNDGTTDEPTALAITPGSPCLLEWEHAAGTLSIRKDGGTASTVASGDTNVTQLLRFGAGYNNTFFGNFDCCEIMAFNRALAAGESQALRRYVGRRYAISVP